MIAAFVLSLQIAGAAALPSSSDEAAALAIDRLTESFGPYPARTSLVTPPWPWLTTSHGMEREAEIVRALVRQWWGERVMFDAAVKHLGEGLVLYLQSRIVEDLFDRRWQARAYALDVRRYFGGFVPWQLRTIPVSRLTVGLARDVYLGRPHTRRRRDVTPAIARVALGFGSLEQQYTWPVLERGLRAVADQHTGKTIDLQAFAATLSQALAVDVSPFIAAIAGQNDVTSRVARVAAAPCEPAPCVRTAIDLDGAGRDAWPVRLRFEDASQLGVTWRPASGATVWVESAAAPAAASIDPGHTNLLDRDYRDNTVVLRPSTDVPIRKWTAQWVMWLQHIMLTYSAVL
jgi:hypothetical protein